MRERNVMQIDRWNVVASVLGPGKVEPSRSNQLAAALAAGLVTGLGFFIMMWVLSDRPMSQRTLSVEATDPWVTQPDGTPPEPDEAPARRFEAESSLKPVDRLEEVLRVETEGEGGNGENTAGSRSGNQSGSQPDGDDGESEDANGKGGPQGESPDADPPGSAILAAIADPLVVEAESYLTATGQTQAEDGDRLAYITDGHSATYHDVDFSKFTSVIVSYASKGFGGRLELRAGSDNGPVVASVDLEWTGSWSTFVQTGHIEIDHRSHEPLVLVFRNPQRSGDELFLYNLDSVMFLP